LAENNASSPLKTGAQRGCCLSDDVGDGALYSLFLKALERPRITPGLLFMSYGVFYRVKNTIYYNADNILLSMPPLHKLML